jgi:CDP-paratose 2-epimerase
VKILVTGGLGVIGSRFVEIAMASGHDITIIDSAEEPRNLWMADKLKSQVKSQIEIFIERVENANFRSLLRNHDLVLHAAAHTGIPHSELDPTDDWVSNVEASRNILEAMRQEKSQTPVIMLSSVKPYKINHLQCAVQNGMTYWPEQSHGVDESFVLEPDEPYAASKMAQTGLVMAYGRSYDLPVTVLRCSNLYGDAPCHGPRHGWLTWFCISAALDWPIEIQGTGFQTRDMLFADDVASAVFAAQKNIDQLRGNVYNIGGGSLNRISCIEAVGLIERILGHSIKVNRAPARKNDDMLFVTNHQKFTSITDWKPVIGVDEGVRRILRWAQANKEHLARLYMEYV